MLTTKNEFYEQQLGLNNDLMFIIVAYINHKSMAGWQY